MMGRRLETAVRAQQGFTLIEIMIVVAIVAVLAGVVVPMFATDSNKAKASTEVSAMFAELSAREEQYKVDNGSYLAAAACPATPSVTGTAASTCTSTTPWTTLRVAPPQSTLRCSYQIVTGTGTGTNNPVAGFTFTSPVGSWYYALATCNMDGSTTVNSTYFTSSVDSSIQKQNEGK